MTNNGEDKYEMLNKLFGNRDARQMTVKRCVEIIFAGGFVAGFGVATVGLGSTINALFGPAPPSPSLGGSVVMSVVGLGLGAAFGWLTFRMDEKAKECLVLAEPSDVQQG